MQPKKSIQKEGEKMRDFRESFCLNCGKPYFAKFRNKSCDTCYHNYMAGMKYSRCLKCGKEKNYDSRGLCEKCYFETRDKAYAINWDWW